MTSSQHVFVQDGLRGFNLPLDCASEEAFVNILNRIDDVGSSKHIRQRLIPLRELTMLDLMDRVTDKPGWEEKVFNDEIAERWKAEAIANETSEVTRKMADWIIEELRCKAKLFKETGSVVVFEGDVVKSDIAVSSETQASLQAAVHGLENVPEVYKDWHPRSDGKVLDLVHPSLFPLIYGRSRILPAGEVGLDDCIESCGKGVVIPSDEERGLDNRLGDNYAPSSYSTNFQWLPSHVSISMDGKASITSYINNLHPQRHKKLYSVIEDVIEAAIPLWNTTLSFGGIWTLDGGSFQDYKRISYTVVAYDLDPDCVPEDERPQQEDDEDEDSFLERIEEWKESIRRLVLPEPGEFQPRPILEPGNVIDLKKDYAITGLQIIVKLANIHLTPEKPEYEGGSWHVEGQLNEHICATALYYYDSENITTSRLAFRQQSNTDEAASVMYPDNEHSFLSEVFGFKEMSAVQEIGSVNCIPGRLLTFPNFLQHQVQPFKLEDPTKLGHRKILALFLVDPNIDIISTANVPPQRRDWWSENVMKDFAREGNGLAKLSPELRDQVFRSVDDFPIGMEDAKEVRLKLMDERSVFVSKHKSAFERHEFNLCEH